MLESGKYQELISEKIAGLRTESAQSGTLGLTNLKNKHSENFIRKLLNLVYGYSVINLSRASANYPGLDFGDENVGVAFQVASEKTSDRLEGTPQNVIRYKHYTTFGKNRVLILTVKQGSYTIGVDTSPDFNFEWKQDVIGFSDVLKDFQHLETVKLAAIYGFLENELPETISTIKSSGDIQVKLTIHLINILKGLEKSLLNFSEHFRCSYIVKEVIFQFRIFTKN